MKPIWKKRTIAIVTFLAGLYYFLEFLVPPTIPWKTTEGIVKSYTSSQVNLSTVKETIKIRLNDKMSIQMITDSGKKEVEVDALRPGNTVFVNTGKGKILSGILMPSSTRIKLDLGRVAGSKTAQVLGNNKTLVLRMKAGGAPETIPIDQLKMNDWVKVGPNTYLSGYMTDVNNFFLILVAMAWGMGLLSLWLVHSANIRKRRPDWYMSVIFFVFLIVGLIAGKGSSNPTDWWKWTVGVNNIALWDVLMPMGSTVFSLLTFYMASAAYRSFKAKSAEAVLMMVSALIVMLGQIAISAPLTHASQWILYIVNSAAVRGMWFGMMLGAIAVGLRFWLSLERGAFFDTEL